MGERHQIVGAILGAGHQCLGLVDRPVDDVGQVHDRYYYGVVASGQPRAEPSVDVDTRTRAASFAERMLTLGPYLKMGVAGRR